jgi:2'-5' RNA ligase
VARLFLALELPLSWRQRLAAIPLGIDRARREPEERLHLTVRFLGEVDPAAEALLRERLRALEGPAVEVGLAGVGTFGEPPRVLWAGLAPPAPLLALAAAVEGAVRASGLPPTDGPFAPHVTLARLRAPAPDQLRRFLAEHRDLTSPPARLDELALVASEPLHGGRVHRVVDRFRWRWMQPG